MINWRALLGELRVEWSDRGPNRSAGEITIKCPICGRNDPSRHMAINEATGAYYCFRNPGRHSGKSAKFLLARIGVASTAIAPLIMRHSDDRTSQVVERVRGPAHWERYEPAVRNPRILEYLADRGFDAPSQVALQFDMRFAFAGKYAQRVLLPIDLDGEVGFTGRALLPHMSPKYLTHESVQHAIYAPILGADDERIAVAALLGLALTESRIQQILRLYQKVRTLVIVEGPFDAVKVAWATRLLRGYPRSLLVGLDSDQPVTVVYDLINELAPYVGRDTIIRARLPDWAKDPGELELEECRTWIASSLNGAAFSKDGRAALYQRTSGA